MQFVGNLLEHVAKIPFETLILMVIALAIWVIPHTVMKQWRKAREAEIAANLKHAMLERGFSAPEIERLHRLEFSKLTGTDLPMAAEVVIESDGEYAQALVLKRDGEKFYIHFVGQSMDENEWVDLDRVFFPARTVLAQTGAPVEAGDGLAPAPPVKEPLAL